MVITASTVRDLRFGTYLSSRGHRGRHSSWPCAGGTTRSHGRRAGAWLRLGSRSWWLCLDRPCRWTRAGHAQRAANALLARTPHVPPVCVSLARPQGMRAPYGWCTGALLSAATLSAVVLLASLGEVWLS
jgi:hypothetical protein